MSGEIGSFNVEHGLMSDRYVPFFLRLVMVMTCSPSL